LQLDIKKADTSLDYIPIWSPSCSNWLDCVRSISEEAAQERLAHPRWIYTKKEIENPFGKARIIKNRRWTHGLSDAALEIPKSELQFLLRLDQSIRTREHVRFNNTIEFHPLAVLGTRTVCT